MRKRWPATSTGDRPHHQRRCRYKKANDVFVEASVAPMQPLRLQLLPIKDHLVGRVLWPCCIRLCHVLLYVLVTLCMRVRMCPNIHERDSTQQPPTARRLLPYIPNPSIDLQKDTNTTTLVEAI